MKKMLGCVLAVLALSAAWMPAGHAAEESYQTVVPVQCNRIEKVTDRYLVALSDHATETQPLYDLLDWEGNPVISDASQFDFCGNWILAQRDGSEANGGQSAVYTYDTAECRVPFSSSYTRIWLTGESTAVGLHGTNFVRPGYWVGTGEQIDLKTGTVTAQLGDCSEGDGQISLPGPLQTANEMDASLFGPYGMLFRFYDENDQLIASAERKEQGSQLQQYGEKEYNEARFARAYNQDGQLLLSSGENSGQVSSYLCGGSNGSLLYLWTSDGPTGHNYVYTGRGRLLQKQDAYGFRDGQYLITTGETPMILSRDGETVIPAGVFDHYAWNYGYAGVGGVLEIVSSRDDLAIVEKDGRWGVIQLPERLPQPSDWAQEEAAQAEKAGLISKDLQLWWRDSCTRLEFCQMLARTVEAVTGQTIAELAQGKPKAVFSDCEDPAVLAAAGLGLIQGVGNNKFAPGLFLTREQAATLLARAAGLLEIPATAEPAVYADADQFSSWAEDSIRTISTVVSQDGRAVMQGTGKARFSPAAYYTVEQSALSLYRLLRSA